MPGPEISDAALGLSPPAVSLVQIQDLVRFPKKVAGTISEHILLATRGEPDRSLFPGKIDFHAPQAIQYMLNLIQGALGQNKRELIAAEAHRQIRSANGLGDTARKSL